MGEKVTAVCPHCDQSYAVPAAAVGKRASCKSCGVLFRIVDGAAVPADAGTYHRWWSAPQLALVGAFLFVLLWGIRELQVGDTRPSGGAWIDVRLPGFRLTASAAP